MKHHILFVGTKFLYNEALCEYVLRKVKQTCGVVEQISYYKDGDSALLLDLQQQVNVEQKLVVITTKQNASTIGKVLCTATEDVQVVQNGMLLPQKTVIAEQGSYLLEYKQTIINLLQVEKGAPLPPVLIEEEHSDAIIHIFDESVETLQSLLHPIAQTYEVQFELITLVDGWQKVVISSKRYGEITNFVSAAKKLLPNNVIDAPDVMEYMIEKLASLGKKITFAESCTGGLLSYFLTKHNGASKILDGSLVTYSNILKDNWLAVSEESLQNYGAVSAEVVAEMSEGALNVSHADYAIAVSGIAGDTGGTPQKPVGTVYIGVRSHNDHKEEHLHFQGDRNFVQNQSVLYAVKMLLLLDRESFF